MYSFRYRRGLELYGGPATRLQEPWVKEFLNRYCLVIIEGMNNVMPLMNSKSPPSASAATTSLPSNSTNSPV